MRRAISFRLSAELLARVDARAEELGQSRTKFVERALEAALSEAEDPTTFEQAGSGVRSRGGSQPASVKPAASPRTHEEKPEKDPLAGGTPLPKIAARRWAK